MSSNVSDGNIEIVNMLLDYWSDPQVIITGGKPQKPSQFSVNSAATSGYIDMLQLLAGLNPPVLTNKDGANLALRRGQLKVL